jgi:hypothetical protein
MLGSRIGKFLFFFHHKRFSVGLGKIFGIDNKLYSDDHYPFYFNFDSMNLNILESKIFVALYPLLLVSFL